MIQHSECTSIAVSCTIREPASVGLTVVVVALSDRVGSNGTFALNLSGIRFFVALVVVLAYHFVTEALTATSPGKRLLGLMVVDARGGRPSRLAITGRTVFRLIDAIPAFYLVGFIVVLATPQKQRVGDMIANTRVVSISTADDSAGSRPRSAFSAIVLAVVAAATLAAGITGLASSADGDDRDVAHDTVGSFDFQSDVVPYVDQIVDRVFRDPNADALMNIFVAGAASRDQATQAMDQLDELAGGLVGDYEITDHRVRNDLRVDELNRSFDEVDIKIDADFENGPGQLLLAIVDVDGQLQLLSWNITMDAT